MTTSRSSSVLIAYTNSASANELEDILSLTARFQTMSTELGKLKEMESAAAADVIVVDLQMVSDKELDLLAEARKSFPDTPMIVISEALSGTQMRRLFKLHIEDWLPTPLDKKQLHAALQSAVRTAKTTNSLVHAVVSASGGAGATSIAISLAQALAQTKGKVKPSVALFDLDFSTGNCGYILNQPPSTGIDSVIESPSRIDAEFVSIIGQSHSEKFDIFSFKRPDVVIAQNSQELVLRMLDAVSIQHDHTVLDIPYYETAWKEDVLGAVNSITIVTEMNLPALKHAKELAERIKKARSDDYELNVIINKHESSWLGGSIKSKALKQLFGDIPLHSVGSDDMTMREAFDRGVLPSEVNARSKFLKDLRKFLKVTKITEVSK